MLPHAEIWLSVIIPSWNGAPYLRCALDSVVAQHDLQIEVIAVDDGSTDDTCAILAEYADRLNLTIVQRPCGQNWVRNTNYGMSLARGRFICWLHQDDLWAPDRLAQLKPLLAAHSDATFVFHPASYIDAAGRRVGLLRCPERHRTGRVPEEEVFAQLLVQNFIAAPATLFRSDCLAQVGPLDESLWYLADWDFWLRLTRSGTIAFHEAPLSCFRIHDASQTWSRSNASEDVESQFTRVLDRYLGDWQQAATTSHRRATITRAALFSAHCNLALMSSAHGDHSRLARIAPEFLRLGPRGWALFFKHSRIVDRCVARLKIRYHRA